MFYEFTKPVQVKKKVDTRKKGFLRQIRTLLLAVEKSEIIKENKHQYTEVNKYK